MMPRLELARSAAFTGGPALAGAMVSWAGAPAAFILATVLSVSAFTLVLRLVEPARHVPPRRDPLTEIYEGISFTWHEPMLRPMLITAVIYNISWFILQAVYVPHAIRVLGMSAHAVGLTLAMSGGGMATGAVISSRLITVLPFGRVIQIGPVLAVLAAALMVATIAFPHASLAGLSLALFGVGSMVWTISSTTLRQSRAAGPMLGRVSSVFLTATAGARPIEAALGAAIGTMWGDTTCLVVALVGFAIQACLILRSRIASLGHLP
ncbi:hypothetical protein C798_20085 [Herbaspirillum rubrisubalbicans Os34]|uniref:MFS transporter n=2 Tax=Herbaspirillum rubrisubalbicans TaxID=80842 RepID=A0A6M3ZV38_9BURK|nr:hypothetical protein C798_20085 [Herbaspirillum rubrisubalbicans Os34]